MGKSLVIVESPAKIKALSQFLGSGYIFESSFGHIRDLPENQFGIDIEKDFEPNYVTLSDKKQVISKLKKAAQGCDSVLLAPDPDREGEAIAWHISKILPAGIPIKRVTFNSITKAAVREALAHPLDIDMSLVNAQQARRLLDRLVGYTISPLLNKRLRRQKGKAVSAGRVQSSALKMVVDREREIEAFRPKEYWTLIAQLETQKAPKPFEATLFSIDGKKIEKEPVANKVENEDYVLINTAERANAIADDLQKNNFVVGNVTRGEKKRFPEAPFITSTLQQEAWRHFHFSPSKTMQIAQQLYEGVDLGRDGVEGLITYMRTDSVRISKEALDGVRSFIVQEFGQNFLNYEVRSFEVKKSAQDAHEAIRPTALEHPPEVVRKYLSRDQFQLYSLIWKRFVACQMMPAIYDTMVVDIIAGPKYLLRATGSILRFQGFLAVYEEKQDEIEKGDGEGLIPPLEEKDPLRLLDLAKTQSFTRPPPRYTEASLIKALERSGIGRPSTYAAIMNKIQSRDYTIKEAGRLKPTELGRIITGMLEDNFTRIVDIGFTAAMEDDLELVAESKKEWKVLLADFWKEFAPTLKLAETHAQVPKIETEFVCPKCGAKLQKIWSKSKYFLGCTNYPTCDYTSSLEQATFSPSDYAEDFNWDQKCPRCGLEMKLRFGRYGPFLGCSTFPQCRGIVSIPKKGEREEKFEEVACPAEGCEGKLLRRRSRFGKYFLSCSTFPDCDVIGNDIETIRAKYAGRPKTAYTKKQKGGTKMPAKKVKKAIKKVVKKKAKKKTTKR
jgi:DNA topoisomerase-1